MSDQNGRMSYEGSLSELSVCTPRPGLILTAGQAYTFRKACLCTNLFAVKCDR